MLAVASHLQRHRLTIKRPFALRVLPPRLRGSIWSRLYRPTAERFRGLFVGATLHFAPAVRMELLPGDVISDSVAFTGIYDLLSTRELCRLAKRGGTMVDVGANLGYFSLLWAAARPDNSVVAFEASPRNVEYLHRNVAVNGFTNRIDIRSEAVGKDPGEMQFDPGPADQTGWGGLSLESTDKTTRVPVVRLDDVLCNTDEITLLKIDIEGADTWAILGAERLLRERRVKHIWWEQNRPRMRLLRIPEERAAQFLSGFGYEVVPQTDLNSNVVHWSATYH